MQVPFETESLIVTYFLGTKLWKFSERPLKSAMLNGSMQEKGTHLFHFVLFCSCPTYGFYSQHCVSTSPCIKQLLAQG